MSHTTPIMPTATPTPLDPSTSTPFRDLVNNLKPPEVEPPERPKSTPFPQQDAASPIQPTWRMGNDEQNQLLPKEDFYLAEQAPSSKMTFAALPTEIHECILDHLFGVRGSTVYSHTSSKAWSTALRHSRRRQLSDLALINASYRELVQGRLFKHSGLDII